jgi:pimeloyl-ACP methyl ester carboxylesterase
MVGAVPARGGVDAAVHQTVPVTRSRRLPAVLAALALTATACAGGGPTPAAPSGPAPGAAPVSWTSCETGAPGFECARLTVPLDEADPTAGDLELLLTRLPATDAQRRVGSLVVNPGGPGSSAVGFLQAAATLLPEPLRERFDLVAFDPRGVGGSAPVRCATTAELDRYVALDPVPDDASELAALTTAAADLAAGCQQRSGRLLPHVSTAVAARDLERVREAVGDDRLSYLGYSYGTELGAAYLEQFPDRVRVMVLDGAVDPALAWDERLAAQAVGFERALADFAAECARFDCPVEAADRGVLGAVDRLAEQVEQQPLPGDGERTVGPGELSVALLSSLYRAEDWPLLAEGLADAQDGDGGLLLALSDRYLERGPDGYSGTSEANLAVSCLDRPWPRDPSAYVALADRLRDQAPRFGPLVALSALPCASWPAAPVASPAPASAPGAPPVVVLGTTRDPATPYAWAVALAEQLPGAVLLTHDGDGHTVYFESAPACLRRPVDAYLLTGAVPTPVRC